MTAYTPNSGGDVFYDTLTSPSVNATLDTWRCKRDEFSKIKMCIYKITNKINGKSYIGQTTNSVYRRWVDSIQTHC